MKLTINQTNIPSRVPISIPNKWIQIYGGILLGMTLALSVYLTAPVFCDIRLYDVRSDGAPKVDTRAVKYKSKGGNNNNYYDIIFFLSFEK